MEVTKSIVIHLERKQLVIATEEVSWLGIPFSTIDGNAGGQAHTPKDISIYPVIHKSPTSLSSQEAGAAGEVQESKNKDGNGNKRKNRRPNNDPLTSGVKPELSSKHTKYGNIPDNI